MAEAKEPLGSVPQAVFYEGMAGHPGAHQPGEAVPSLRVASGP